MKKLALLLTVLLITFSCKKEDKSTDTQKPVSSPDTYAGFAKTNDLYFDINLGYWVSSEDTSSKYQFTIHQMYTDSAVISFSEYPRDKQLTVKVENGTFLKDELVLTSNPGSQTSTYSYSFDLEIRGDSLLGKTSHSWFPSHTKTFYFQFIKQ